MYINNNSYFQLVTFIISFITHQKIILCGRGLDYVVPNLTSSRRLKHFCHKAELSPFSPNFLKLLSSDSSQLVHFHFHFHFHLFHHFPKIAFFTSIPACALSFSLFTFTFFTSPQIAFFRSIPTCAPAQLYIMYEMHPGNLKLAHLQRRLSI